MHSNQDIARALLFTYGKHGVKPIPPHVWESDDLITDLLYLHPKRKRYIQDDDVDSWVNPRFPPLCLSLCGNLVLFILIVCILLYAMSQ